MTTADGKETPRDGASLRAARIQAGLTLEALATAAGVSVSYLSRAETGRTTPTPKWFASVHAAIAAEAAA